MTRSDTPATEAPSALEQVLARGRVRATLTMLGPAFVASIAYVDPGNFATNVQGGAQFGYLLLWVVLAANAMAMLIREPAHPAVLQHLGLQPLLDLRLRAGEGVGAALGTQLLRTGLQLRSGTARTTP